MTAICLLFVFLFSRGQSATVHIFVSPSGSDSNSGLNVGHPLKTLNKAKSLLDSSAVHGNTVFVELMQGYHDLTTTLHFTHKYTAPITFRAYQGQEVHVTGGKRLAASQFRPVQDHSVLQILLQSARHKVLQIHLPSAGITDYGEIREFGYYRSNTKWLELFINGNPTRLAQYPNEGQIDITKVDNPQGRTFTHGSREDKRWIHEKEPWAIGYWYRGWADQAVKISHIDAHTHQITLATTPRFGLAVGYYNDPVLQGSSKQGGYFRVFNMLSELDEPGEYYIDRSTGTLYVWPNTPDGTMSSSDIIYASVIDSCIVLEPYHRNINFEGFILEACRRSGIDIISGQNINLQNLEIKNTGAYAINCSHDCKSVSVSRCDIHHTCGGVYIQGGDRVTLEANGHVVEDNHIWQFSRIGSVGYNAIYAFGVGTSMRYNHIHDGPYNGIKWNGNDHLMEFNHIHHLCVNASDCGAMHANRDWTQRGHIVRFNHIHHTLRFAPGAQCRGIMLDDQFSSVVIENNVFHDNEVHTNIGGGRDNIIRYNVMFNATGEPVQVDGRGLTGRNLVKLNQRLHAVPYTNPLWTSKYPKLAHMKNGTAPEGNEIYNNVYYQLIGHHFVDFHQHHIQKTEYFNVRNNYKVSSESEFMSPGSGNFRLKGGTVTWANANNFPQPLTQHEVGPRYPTGPAHGHSGHAKSTRSTPSTATAHVTLRPSSTGANTSPKSPLVSDGSGPNLLYPNIPKQGCWLVFSACPKHPEQGLHRDTYGEQHHGTGAVEENCLTRAASLWHYCGSPDGDNVTAIFGPTGAMTIAGKHCYFADFGCPVQHTSYSQGHIHVDTYGEQHGGLTNAGTCLHRALQQWKYCGSSPDYPISSIYGPTGAVNHIGAGCWVKISSCPAHSSLAGFFYDATGASTLNTDHNSAACLARASYYWNRCGSHKSSPVKAYYKSEGLVKEVP